MYVAAHFMLLHGVRVKVIELGSRIEVENRTDTDRAGVVQGLMAEGTSAAEDMAALVLGRLMG